MRISTLIGPPARAVLLAASIFSSSAQAQEFPTFGWPTDNNAVLHGRPENFYMHVDRNFEGQMTKPWQAGGFGFVRTPMRCAGQVVETKFHEGIDIKPLLRDAQGAPEDVVRSLADGKVVHVNSHPGHSNYGNYIVVEHTTALGPLFSLYAHLARTDVQPGQAITRGHVLGLMGWTGEGLNKERAHLHLELCLLLHSDFESWHAAYAPGQNHHGIYNGLNLVGLEVPGILIPQAKGETISSARYLRNQTPAWRAAIPKTARFELAQRYPWLVDGNIQDAPSVEIAFSRDGQPLSIRPFPAPLNAPKLVWVAETKLPTTIFTNHRLTKQGNSTHLTGSGERFLNLIAGQFSAPQPPNPAEVLTTEAPTPQARATEPSAGPIPLDKSKPSSTVPSL